MLVVHPSSRCDICLEAYSWESLDQSPHAIPCGHIFCKTCLQSVTPSNCPLCRKAYLPERAKKLHVDRPDSVNDESTPSQREIDLLQQLSLVWGETIPEEELSVLTRDVDTFLEGRAPELSLPLRKARDALVQYRTLKEKRHRDREKLHRLEQVFKSAIDRANADQNTFKVVEENLLSKVEDLTHKESDLHSEIERLRAELAKYQYTTNPLPPPPQPVPLERFPPFARAAAAGLHSDPNPTSNVPSNTSASAPPTLPFPSQDQYRSSAGDVSEESLLSSQTELDREARRREKQPMHNDYGKSSDSHAALRTGLERRPAKEAVVPGASPNQRVIPGGTPKTTMDPAAPATAYVTAYGEAYTYGFAYADPSTFNLDAVATALPTPGPSRNRTVSRTPGPEYYQSPHRATPTQASVMGLGLIDASSDLGSSANRDTPQALQSESTGSRSQGAHRPRARRSSTTTGSNSILDGHASDSFTIQSGSRTNHSSQAAQERRRQRRYSHEPAAQTTQAQLQRAPSIAEHPSEYSAPDELLLQATQPSVLNRSNTTSDRASISSWGTVSTSSLPIPGSTSSVGALPLTSFPPVPIPPIAADENAVSLSGPDPYYPFGSFNAAMSTSSLSSAPVQHRPSTASEANGAPYDMDSLETNNLVLTPRSVITPRAHSSTSVPGLDPRQALSMLLETNVAPGSSHTRAVLDDRPRRRSRHTSSSASSTRHGPVSNHAQPTADYTPRPTAQRPASIPTPSNTSATERSRRHTRGTSHVTAAPPNASSRFPISTPATTVASGPAPFVDEGYLSDANGRNSGSNATIVVNPSRASMRGDEGLGNALGLDLTDEPQSIGPMISAPTPIVSSRAFLRSWSYDR